MRWTYAFLLTLILSGCTNEVPPPREPAAEPSKTTAKSAAEVTHDPAEPAPEKPEPTAVVESVKPQSLPIGETPLVGKPPEAFNFPQPPLEMPKVLLTEAEEKSSLIKVGDSMPDVSLPDLDGKQQQLSKLLGPKLTVLTFWKSSQPFGVEEIADLGPVVLARFANKGVKVVGISERDSAATARATLKKVGGSFVNLIDAKGTALASVATRELPRTYLLDPSGKVLWFDLEYSRSTRRDLVRAIQFALSAAK